MAYVDFAEVHRLCGVSIPSEPSSLQLQKKDGWEQICFFETIQVAEYVDS